jgi:serine/threonine protein phosphatase 1
MSTWAITDIHGCANTFAALLRRINFSQEDTLFLLGDYIDRGPRSKQVLDLIFELRETGHQVECLLGNHDWVLLHALDEPDTEEAYNWKSRFGGKATLRSFGVTTEQGIPTKYIDLLESMEYYREYKDMILVHAGLNLRAANPLTDYEAMLWIRNGDRRVNRDWLGERLVVHGHTPYPRRKIQKQAEGYAKHPLIGIDNGCVYQRHGMNHLCALELDTMELVFEQNADN